MDVGQRWSKVENLWWYPPWNWTNRCQKWPIFKKEPPFPNHRFAYISMLVFRGVHILWTRTRNRKSMDKKTWTMNHPSTAHLHTLLPSDLADGPRKGNSITKIDQWYPLLCHKWHTKHAVIHGEKAYVKYAQSPAIFLEHGKEKKQENRNNHPLEN